jgi:hypothetical protein
MADLIIVLVMMLGGVSAAELVRASCRRRLLTPVTARRPAGAANAPVRLGEPRMQL